MQARTIIPRVFLVILVLLTSACAGLATTGQKYTAEGDFAAPSMMDKTAAIELAAEVFRQQEVVETGRSPSSGFISGITYRGYSINRISFLMMVDIDIPAPGSLHVKATSTAGPEVAFTTDLDDIAEDFVRAYGKALGR